MGWLMGLKPTTSGATILLNSPAIPTLQRLHQPLFYQIHLNYTDFLHRLLAQWLSKILPETTPRGGLTVITVTVVTRRIHQKLI